MSLVIIGDGKLKNKLVKLINDLDLNNRVKIFSNIQNPYPYFYNSELFVLSSLWEGFGLVLIEALACELKIVATDCPCSPKSYPSL